jgi:phosphatidylglycerol:prolipoprotein diacylglycerol transferase
VVLRNPEWALPDWRIAPSAEFLRLWQGLSSFGGFIVCVPLSVWFFKKERVAVWPYLDCLAHGMAIGWFFGRMGCFAAHDHPGTPTEFWLGVYGICREGLGDSVACHDMGLYEAFWSGAMYLIFLWMDRRRAWIAGTFVLLLGSAYGPVRFFMDFLRPEATDVRYYGFTPAQYLAAVLTLVAWYFLYRRMTSGEERYVQPKRE